MSRLIDADSLKDELNAWARVITKPTLMGSDEVMCVIDHAPTIDAVPVVHGEWVKGIHIVECSACSEKFDFGDETWVEDYDICEDIGWKFCPNCGAKMDGEEQDDGRN